MKKISCVHIFVIVLFWIPGQCRNPQFQLGLPVTNFPEQSRTGIPENSLFWLNPSLRPLDKSAKSNKTINFKELDR